MTREELAGESFFGLGIAPKLLEQIERLGFQLSLIHI